MLVLSRKIGERIVINESITVEITKIKGNRCLVAIVAPKDVSFVRDELKKDKKAA